MIPENATIIDDDVIESKPMVDKSWLISELEKFRELAANYEDQYLRGRAEFHN